MYIYMRFINLILQSDWSNNYNHGTLSKARRARDTIDKSEALILV